MNGRAPPLRISRIFSSMRARSSGLKAASEQKIVIEAVIDRRADAEPDSRDRAPARRAP